MYSLARVARWSRAWVSLCHALFFSFFLFWSAQRQSKAQWSSRRTLLYAELAVPCAILHGGAGVRTGVSMACMRLCVCVSERDRDRGVRSVWYGWSSLHVSVFQSKTHLPVRRRRRTPLAQGQRTAAIEWFGRPADALRRSCLRCSDRIPPSCLDVSGSGSGGDSLGLRL